MVSGTEGESTTLEDAERMVVLSVELDRLPPHLGA